METSNCIFCKIVAGSAPARIAYRDEQVTAFHDASPVTPVHILVVPNRHIASLNEAGEDDAALLGHMLMVAGQVAAQEGIANSGFRVALNTGPDAGQTVFHVHMHLMGGRKMSFRNQ